MRERRKYWYEIRAWADGWEIEADGDGEWVSVKCPTFIPSGEFRVVPDAEGWLPWYGGECPVGGDAYVEMNLKGNTYLGQAVGLLWEGREFLYRITKEADPYAELKAAAKDPTKQIRRTPFHENLDWHDSGYHWSWYFPPENYKIRDKPCECGDRAIKNCPGKFEQGCDLGANEKFVGVSKPTTKVKLLAFIWKADGDLIWRIESNPVVGPNWKRVPSEDKVIEVEE